MSTKRRGLLQHQKRVEHKANKGVFLGFFSINGISGRVLRPFSAKGKASFLNEWEIVVNILKKFQKVEPSTISAAPHFQQNFGLNSLDTCELVMAFQEKFSIKSPDSEADKIDSCAVAIDYIIKNGKPS
ncbi:hypothetical protein KP509_23G003500 [Ceratopteris richardii]|uniref:Carrier domain-containing protein n=1 Tax=Ceratopteris richardii TaxID=49495 RepID=A0A8T2RZT6_CERRI|nr:hypothetical protein KP509_23G003500 [Ceratopteris richardii]